MKNKTTSTLTLKNWFDRSIRLLKNNSSIGAPELDCQIIAEYVLRIPRYKIFTQPDFLIPTKELYVLKKYIIFRYLNLPTAYIVQKKEFYGHDFIISPAVLIPRPESELMVELAKYMVSKLKKRPILDSINTLSEYDVSILDRSLLSNYHDYDIDTKLRVADIGCGSGNIGISLSIESDDITVDLIDISKKALKITKLNVNKFATNNLLIHGDLLNGNSNKYELILANLPYVPILSSVNPDVLHEPLNSVFSGIDGLFLYRRLFSTLSKRPDKPLYILIEKFPEIDQDLKQLSSFYNLKQVFQSLFINVYSFK